MFELRSQTFTELELDGFDISGTGVQGRLAIEDFLSDYGDISRAEVAPKVRIGSDITGRLVGDDEDRSETSVGSVGRPFGERGKRRCRRRE